MYGADPYASVPYATLGGGVILIVAACVHADLQLLYECSVGISQVYIVNATHTVLNSVTMTVTGTGCITNSEVC